MNKIKQLLDLFDEEPRIKWAVLVIIIIGFALGVYSLINVI